MRTAKTNLIWALVLLPNCLTSFSAWAAPSLHHYWVRIPQTSQSCAEEAAALGARFAKTTGLKVMASKCAGVSSVQVDQLNYTLYSLNVDYMAESPIQTYIANLGLADVIAGNLPTDHQGIFATLSDCQSATSAQVAIFEKQTGTPLLSARCELGTWGMSQAFVLVLEGFGSPDKTLQVADFGTEGGSGLALQSGVNDLITRADGVVAGNWSHFVFYYARRQLPMKFLRLGDLTDTECHSQLGAAQEIFKSMETPADAVVQCISSGQDNGATALEAAYVSQPMVLGDFGSRSAPYYSFTECMSNLDRTLEEVSSQGGVAPLGAICTEDILNKGQYLVVLFDSE